MIRHPFNKIVYRPYRQYRTQKTIDHIIGLDSETYTDGRPFMFALSDGKVFTLDDVPDIFFTRKYRDKHYGVWNLKFDSGSLLYKLSPDDKTVLRIFGSVIVDGTRYQYIPHKRLRITRGKNGVSIWDINGFYKMPLDDAARVYLKKRKLKMESKSFTASSVKRDYDKIKRYCIRDAVLVSELYDYLVRGLDVLKIKPKNLYSRASLSQHYFNQYSQIVDISRFWKNYRELVYYACMAYWGGKFEVYRRGRYSGIMYDINSAYPYHMRDLIDIRGALVKQSKRYLSDATYGYIYATVHNTRGVHVPCCVIYNHHNVYPAGTFKTFLTKTEYDYLRRHGVKTEIHNGWYLYCNTDYRPYRDTINTLHAQKEIQRGKNKLLYMLYKIMMNSYYGKMAQLTPTVKNITRAEYELIKSGMLKPEQVTDTIIKAGPCFNPMYAAEITARTRIMLSEICQENYNHVIAAHTDSVILDRPLSRDYIGNKLGDWTYECDGDGVMIACGVYQIGEKNKFRGLDVSGKMSWTDLLRKNGTERIIKIPQTIVRSWIEANFHGRDGETNQFIEQLKNVDLNCDVKRLWPCNINARDLVNKTQKSLPIILVY